MALTDKKLKSMLGKKHDGLPIKISDRDGLTVLHRPTGKLSFVVRYRFEGKSSELAIGMYPNISLAEARQKAADCKKQVREGYDPKIMRKLGDREKLEVVTVEQAVMYWFNNYAVNKRANHAVLLSQFKRHIFPHIGMIPLEKCETRHWVEVFDAITSGKYHRAAPKTSGILLQVLKQALKYCRNRHYAFSSALEDLNVSDIGERHNKKERFLSWSELMEVWQWSLHISSHWYYRNLVNLLIVFGCRTQELRLSKVDEWDLNEMVWTVPKENSKADNEIKRPIPDCIKDHITMLIHESKNGFLLGELKNESTVSGYGRRIHKKLGQKHWTLHDLRRTFDTTLNDMSIEPYVVEQLLGHALSGVMAVYNRSHHLEKKRVALDIWTAKLYQLEPQQKNVVGIR